MTFTLPASQRWERYAAGKVVARGNVAQPESLAIDFCACREQSRSARGLRFGVKQEGLDTCALRARAIGGELRVWRVPRGLGWQAFPQRGGLESFERLAAYAAPDSATTFPLRPSKRH